MKKFLATFALLLAFTLPGFAQGQVRLSAEDQKKFDKHYAKWVNDTRKNDRDDIAKDVHEMQEIMAKYNIPANVPYDQLLEMDQVNGQFPQTDVVLVVGANDVVNPAARDDPSSPIYGMPILDVDRARNIIVLKRSMGHGFAGIDNALFYHEKTRMLFGDARQSLTQIGQALKAA